MDDLYRDYILDHYRHPRNFGVLASADVSHEDANPLCGDRIRIDLAFGEGQRVEDVRFSGRGCAISQAAASLLTEMVKGAPPAKLARLGRDDVLDALGIEVSPARLKCALLALKVLRSGLYGEEGWPGEEER